MFLVHNDPVVSLPQYGGEQWLTAHELVLGDKVIFRNATGATYTMIAYKHHNDVNPSNNGLVVVDVPQQLLTMAIPILVQIEGVPESKTSLPVVARDVPEYYVLHDNTKQKNHPDCMNVTPSKTVTIPVVRNEEGMCVFENPGLVAGEKHAVIVDGVVYGCECQSMPTDDVSALYLGNVSIASPEMPDTGESFVIFCVPNGDDISMCMMILTTDAEEITIRIPEKVEPIDQKYLPESAGYVQLDVPYALLNDVFQSGFVFDLPAETVAALDDAYDNHKPLWVVIDPGEFAAFDGQYIATFVQTSAYTHSNETQAGCFSISFMGQYIHFVDRDADGNKMWTVVGGVGEE